MPRRQLHQGPAGERGAVLLVGMVMLMMITLVALGVIRLSMHHTQIVNNEQLRSESASATGYALDMVLNAPMTSWDGYKGAGAPLLINLGLEALDGDNAANSIAVTVRDLACKRARILKKAELVKQAGTFYYVPAADSSCIENANNPLVVIDLASLATSAENSLCATVLYDMSALAADGKQLDATVTMNQGVEVRTDITNMASDCP